MSTAPTVNASQRSIDSCGVQIDGALRACALAAIEPVEAAIYSTELSCLSTACAKLAAPFPLAQQRVPVFGTAAFTQNQA